MIEISQNKLNQSLGQIREILPGLVGNDDLLAHNFAVIAIVLTEQTEFEKQSELLNEIPFLQLGTIIDAASKLSDDPSIRTEALCYVLSLTASGLDVGHIHPSHFMSLASQINDSSFARDTLIGDVFESVKTDIVAAWSRSDSHHRATVNLYSNGTEAERVKTKIPDRIEDITVLATEAYKTLITLGADIAFPVTPHVLHKIGISPDYITFLHQHHIIRLISSPEGNQYRYSEVDAIFALILEQNFEKPAIEHGAKKLGKWRDQLRDDFAKGERILYTAKQRALQQLKAAAH